LAAGSENGDLYVWNTANWKLINKVNTGTVINSVQFTKDDARILTGGNTGHPDYDPSNKKMRIGTVKLWNRKDLSLIYSFEGHMKSVKSTRFSPDEKYIASGSFDNTVRIWDIEKKKEVQRFAMEGGTEAVEFTPDGRYLVAGGHYNYLSVFRTTDMVKVDEVVTAPIEYIDFNKTGQLMVIAQEKTGLVTLFAQQTRFGVKAKVVNSLLNNPDLQEK
jgi:WD40 repeat protein